LRLAEFVERECCGVVKLLERALKFGADEDKPSSVRVPGAGAATRVSRWGRKACKRISFHPSA